MKRLTILATLLFAAVSVSAQDYHIKLWDNTTAPTSNGVTGDEYERKPGTLTNTSSAEIWIYKPAPEKATGQAIVFCPGGGYSQLSIANGHNTCKWFAENGIVGVMLKYRLPNGHSEVPLDDLDKAVATVREMAGELGVDPHKVGVAGTSAGGYLAGSAGVMSESKPDFMVLIYPVVSSDPDKRHLGTFQQLVGKENVETEAAKFSLEKVVDSTACPALIFHSDDDKVVPAINAALLYEKLKANGVKASLHIFPSGGHGWGMSKKFKYHREFQGRDARLVEGNQRRSRQGRCEEIVRFDGVFLREGFGLPAFRCSHREGGAGIAAVDPCSGIFRASSRSVGIAIVAPSGIGTRCGAGESRRAVRGAAVQNIRLRIKVAGNVRGLSFCLCVFRRGRPMRRCTAGRSRKIQEVAGARRFSLASGACRKIAPTIGQASTSRQSPQVESPFSDTHLRIRHKSLQ